MRVFYKLYAGSPTYYSTWHTADGIVSYNPGNTILGANHDAGYVAPLYAGSFPFTT